MSITQHPNLLEALLDSWNRSNTIVVNLLHALPDGGFEAKAMDGSPSVAVMFSHIHETRSFWLSKTAPEYAENLPDLFSQEGEQLIPERDPQRIEQALNESAKAVGEAVKQGLETGRDFRGTNIAYDHPILLLQHMLWYEGYHVGQILLALKAVGRPMTDEQTAPAIWDVWRREW